MNVSPLSGVGRFSSGSGLVGLLLTVVILLLLALFLLNGMSKRSDQVEQVLETSEVDNAPLPENDGSLQSTLPDAIERRTRDLEDASKERNRQIESLLNEE